MNCPVSSGVGKRHVRCPQCGNVIPPSQQGRCPREYLVCVSCRDNTNNFSGSDHEQKAVNARDRKRKISKIDCTVIDLSLDGNEANVKIISEPILSILLASSKVSLFKSDSSSKMSETPKSSSSRRKMLTPQRLVLVATDF